MASASQIVKKAQSFVGTKDTGLFNRDYYGSDPGYAWCVVFVWYIFKECGASNLFYDGKKTASCTAVLKWAQANNLIVNNSSGREGDFILFDWDSSGDADHIGIIKCKNSDGSYTTIEGNTSLSNNSNGGQVMERNRKSCIRAIIRPQYDDMRYRVHQQTYGWLPLVNEGECAGWTGKSKRMESFIIESVNYDFRYMVHQQTYGDSKWVYNGQQAGVTGQSKRVEGVAIKCYEKGTTKEVKIRYKLHVQKTGWTDWKTNGQFCGTRGESRRAEAIIIEFI